MSERTRVGTYTIRSLISFSFALTFLITVRRPISSVTLSLARARKHLGNRKGNAVLLSSSLFFFFFSSSFDYSFFRGKKERKREKKGEKRRREERESWRGAAQVQTEKKKEEGRTFAEAAEESHDGA